MNLALLPFALALVVQAVEPAPPDGTLLEVQPCASSPAGVTCERLTYSSDGLRVVALLERPAKGCGTARSVVIHVRGSYVVPELSPESRALTAGFVRSGFAVLSPLLRGSGGSEGRDEMGGADLADVMALPALLRGLAAGRGLDPERPFLYGESRGGMMVFQALRDGFPARAAATVGAFTDFDALLEETPWLVPVSHEIWPDFDARRAEIGLRRSARRWADKLTTPLLLMHGSADRSVPVSHALALASRLASGPPTWALRIFPGGNHHLSTHAEERDRTAVAFFAEH